AGNTFFRNDVSHSRAWGLILELFSGIVVTAENDFNFSGCADGLSVIHSTNSTIENLQFPPDISGMALDIEASTGMTVRNISAHGQGTGYGLFLSAVLNSTFSHIQASNRGVGIGGNQIHDNTFTDNALSGNNYGMHIEGGGASEAGNTFFRNDVSHSRAWGLILELFSGIVVTAENDFNFSGCADGLSVIRSTNSTIENLQFPPDISGMALDIEASTGMTVRNISAHGQGTGYGLFLSAVLNSTFSHIQASNRGVGIGGNQIHGNTFTDNALSGNNYGMHIEGGGPSEAGNTFSGNIIADNRVAGLWLSAVTDSRVGPGNIIRGNRTGVVVVASQGMIITGNTITDNTVFGVATQTSQWTVDARNNYWGHPTGPLDRDVPVEGINDSLGLSNPGGLGNAVTDFILYSPLCLTPACEPSTQLTIDILPVSPQNLVLLGNCGMLPVAVLTTDGFNAADVNPATLTLGNGTGEELPVARGPSGAPLAWLEDADHDGDLDLLAYFSIPELVSRGELGQQTQSLELHASTMQGMALRGSDGVVVSSEPFTVPDLTASGVEASCSGSTRTVTLTARVRNQGDASTSAGLPVAFYRGNPAAGGTLLGVHLLTGPLLPGGEATATLQVPEDPSGQAEVWAVADDDGTGLGREQECREGNNATSAQVSLTCASCIELRLSDYNLFLLGDYTLGTDIQGKVAASGNITLNHFAVGAGLPDSNTARTLVAGGNLTLTHGGVWGDAWYGGSYSADSTVTFARGSSAQGTPINFAARGAALRELSSRLDSLPANGTTTLEPWGGIMLHGTDPNVNVFQVPASAFSGAVLMSIDSPAGSLVVVNISGTAATFRGFGHSFSGGIDQHGVLYNFVNATEITAEGLGFWGTVLAPHADIHFSSGSFDGGIYAKSLTGNAEGHINPLYDRDICQ
ncbi:MAG: choice-of-anchor A family protein, partial [Hyalangium sp.]|uniref:choice-of-anchor A family protein n=1 Tax=Hyalangium sp. TaxID=2028555 RepID=UPI00389B18C5